MFNINNYLDELDCPICSKNTYNVIKKSNYSEIKSLEDIFKIYKPSGNDILLDQLVKCKNCDFQYLNPRINSEIIFNSYQLNFDEVHLNQDKHRIKTFKKSINKIIKNLKIEKTENCKFLDIGSASGAFLKVIKDFGFLEEGYEPSKEMVNYGKKKYNVNINQGSIEDISNESKYDFISFWDVLEHVTNLNETLKKVQKISKKNTFLIINVPDIDSLASKLMRSYWPFYLNVHLYYFNEKSIKKILEKYNFELVKTFPHFQYLELGYLCFRAKKYLSFFSFIERILSIFKMTKLPIAYNLGQTMFVFKKICLLVIFHMFENAPKSNFESL